MTLCLALHWTYTNYSKLKTAILTAVYEDSLTRCDFTFIRWCVCGVCGHIRSSGTCQEGPTRPCTSCLPVTFLLTGRCLPPQPSVAPAGGSTCGTRTLQRNWPLCCKFTPSFQSQNACVFLKLISRTFTWVANASWPALFLTPMPTINSISSTFGKKF